MLDSIVAGLNFIIYKENNFKLLMINRHNMIIINFEIISIKIYLDFLNDCIEK